MYDIQYNVQAALEPDKSQPVLHRFQTQADNVAITDIRPAPTNWPSGPATRPATMVRS